MTLDSQVRKPEEIGDILRREINTGRGLTVSLLAHMFLVWAALGFPSISFLVLDQVDNKEQLM